MDIYVYVHVYSMFVSSCVGRLPCRLQLLLVLASTVILWSESRWIHHRILPSQIRNPPKFEGFLRVYVLLWSRDLVAVETCLQSHWLTTSVSSVSTILALSGHVTTLSGLDWSLQELTSNFGVLVRCFTDSGNIYVLVYTTVTACKTPSF
jgi:hypothetical protein